MESGGGGQMNFWPGFVDALSNMVMAMIFMMMVFMIMMFHYKLHQGVKTEAAQSVKSKQEEASNQDSQQRIKELEAKVQSLNAALASAQSKPAAPRSGSTSAQSVLNHPESLNSKGAYLGDAKQSGNNPPAVEGAGALWTVSYTGREVKLDEGSDKKLRELMADLSTKKPLPHLVLTAEASQSEGYSDSRRLAYYRALGVRNLLLQSGWTSADIDIEIAVRAEPGAQARVLIRAVEGKSRTDAKAVTP
ncbi:hypothetical protein [Herbaspirillum rubrisubalbicans]|uniref:OmpA-like domain-containing protein n=1 Tax=Herbaspirillum rubrisubalbicans TaxID=80842 RepID=A0AAD0U526_9BURK|nr:hypothetical protein [Herbaspirillum rubrisubalbicans]AYR23387.1 hypothetical protein RC54_05910 [Herbaspirillum rubrisubalbicans]